MSDGEPVSIVGIGAMGTAIASRLLSEGARVTVWNRNPAKCESLVAAGAVRASTFEQALDASPLVISCLISSSVAQHLLQQQRPASALAGKTFVDTSTSTPADVQRLAAQVATLGGEYLDAKLMFYPSQVGSDASRMFLSGPRDIYSRFSDVFASIVGETRYVGDDPRRASVLYTAVWNYYYSGLFGFLEALALVATSGMDAREFLEQALASTNDLAGHLRDAAQRIATGRLDGDQAAVDVYIDGFATMATTFDDVGVRSRMLPSLSALSSLAHNGGYGRSDIASVTRALLDSSASGADPSVPDRLRRA
ncbi:MAG: NAD(P)-dependent oxidoreductase [Actinomycetales bacterium]|jgi:3-hydroxyisobutyrate dehydrogenase-like beta-hydroxyacid dehydrogenase|nr:NAD(P)-binding domain-containing protein [Leifsonia sp.]